MVEVFKTDVQKQNQANILLTLLCRDYPAFRINFDLDDCDKILRIEGENVMPGEIIELLNSNGHECEILA